MSTCIQAALAQQPNTVRELLGMPPTKLLVLGISLGYPDLEAPINTYQRGRAEVDEFARWYF